MQNVNMHKNMKNNLDEITVLHFEKRKYMMNTSDDFGVKTLKSWLHGLFRAFDTVILL